MNDILNRGYVSPHIQFVFGDGRFTLDTLPPRYFSSFSQDRTAETACSFTLTLVYAPGTANEKTATIINKVLLSSVNLPVTYRYGYKTPYGGLQLQDVAYTGQFIEYDENLESDGTLTYTIKGVAREIDESGKIYNIQNFLNQFAWNYRTSPSNIVRLLVDSDYVQSIGFRYGVPEILDFFRNYTINIHNTDEEVEVSSLKIPNGTIHDIFCGKANKDRTYNPDGFVSHSYKLLSDDQMQLLGFDVDTLLHQIQAYKNDYNIANRYNSSGAAEALERNNADLLNVWNEYSKIRKMPFVCFFDNVIDSIGSTGKGRFNYIEKSNRQPTNVFIYNYGNKFLDSDVLSFNAEFSGAVAMASVGSLQNVSSNIDANGQQITSNHNIIQADGFTKNTFSSLSGFNESAFISESVVADALNYPFTAKMTVIGQTEVKCLQLLDTIRVNIFVNGVEHPALSGDYSITGISDSISSNGFTTDFTLLKLVEQASQKEVPVYITNDAVGSIARRNQDMIDGKTN